jgi:hypothetical protein
MPDFKPFASHRGLNGDVVLLAPHLHWLGGKVRIVSLRELLKNPDSDFLGRRAPSLPKLAPEPDKFLLLRFVHGNPPSRIQNIIGTLLQDLLGPSVSAD